MTNELNDYIAAVLNDFDDLLTEARDRTRHLDPNVVYFIWRDRDQLNVVERPNVSPRRGTA